MDNIDIAIVSLLIASQLEQKYADCVLRLREEFLRNLEMKKERVLALEAESGGTAAELAQLQEQGIEVSHELRRIFLRELSEVVNED